MKDYILSLLIGNNPSIFASWGASDFETTTDDDLRFRVRGFIFDGLVHVIYDRGYDLFVIRLIDKDTKACVKEIHDIYFDELQSVIDYEIERGSMTDEEYQNLSTKALYELIFS